MIREKRKLNFNYKRITPTIIRRFAQLIHSEATNFEASHPSESILNYSIDAYDNSSYESNSIEIFDEDQLIYQKSVKRIRMRYTTLKDTQCIELQLIEMSDRVAVIDNYILVSGEDSMWVNGIMAKFKDIVNFIEPQPSVNRYSSIVTLCIALVFNVLFFRLFLPYSEKVNNIVAFVIGFGVFLVSVVAAGEAKNYINAAYPCIELQTGQSHQNHFIAKRKKVVWVVTAVGIPLVVAVVYDLVKYML